MRLVAALTVFGIILSTGGGCCVSGAQSVVSEPNLVPTPLRYLAPVVFVLSLGADPTTNTDVTEALARKLEHGPTEAGDQTGFVPEGTWTLNDFVDQCAAYPQSVKGAVVVLPASAEATDDNYLIVIRNEARIAYNAMIVTCTPTAQGGTPQVGWVSGMAEGNYGRSEIQLLPLAALTSVYLALAPQRVDQIVSNRIVPIPHPLPGGGFTTSVSTTQSTTLNSTGTATQQVNVVSVAGIAALIFGRAGSREHFTVHAAEDAAGDFIANQLAIRCPGWRRGASAAAAAAVPSVRTPNSTPEFCSW